MRVFTTSFLVIVLIPLLSFSQKTLNAYECPPCSSHETLVFEHDGTCPVCGMNLIEKADTSNINKVDVKTGSGAFLIEGGGAGKEKTITVFYHKPKNFSLHSPVMIVVPGSGRNGWDYRDAWVEASEQVGLLILAPHYSEEHYPEFWSYNLGGMISGVIINEERTAMLSYQISEEPGRWIWSDFDRMFAKVKRALDLEAESYDMFGHSAGGQILHRMTLFNPDNKAHRILASNSGWYTVPSADRFPFGLKGMPESDKQIHDAFKAHLVVFLGEKDNEHETRGHLVRSPETDKQGTHRLARGTYFYHTAKAYADSLGMEFNWELSIIPDVGHDYRKMSKAAAKYLYTGKE